MNVLRMVLTAAAVALAGCAEDLRFVADERLRFTSPPQRSRVEGPLLVRWSIAPSEFRVVGADGSQRADRGFFAVFVDRPPMAPGEGIAALAEDDPYCRPQVGCPDREWLERNGVHLTRRHALALPGLPAGRGDDLGNVRRHEVTVVLLDGRGMRIGESSWPLTLFTSEDDA